MFAQTTTHASLLARLIDRQDQTAWREFDARYGDLIRGFARRQNLQPADCDDIAQDVLLSLSRTMPGFRYDVNKGKFRSFLKTITLRTIIDRSRQNRGERYVGSIDELMQSAATDPAIEEAWEKEWRRYHLRQAMYVIDAEFNEADHQAFQWYALERRDARETAGALGMSVDQVYQAKSRIAKRLTTLIESQVQEEG